MKKVLFISNTIYDFHEQDKAAHLRKKFEGLSQRISPFVLARGWPWRKKIWGADFYLLKPNIFFWPFALLTACWLCLSKKIDTVIAQSPLIEGFLASILKKILRIELIVEIHGEWLEGPFLVRKRKCEGFLKKIVLLFTRASLASADKIRVVAEYLKEKAQKFAPDKKYFAFHTFTDIDMFLRTKDISFENYILFVGGLYQIKGVDTLIEAFAKIEQEFPNFKLVLIGEGPERQNYQSLINNHQLQDKVELKGRMSLEGTKEMMKKCYCLVLPSLSEGMPRVLLEGMALAKPVLGSRAGGIPELIKDGQNGFLFEKSQADDLAEKMRILLKDKKLAQKIGQQGQAIAQKQFSNKNYLDNYLKMIND